MVLIYHRVKNLDSDPQMLAVSPQNFEKQIAFLKENFNVISLQELIRCLSLKTIPDQSVVITFDDGYADNLLEASPILMKFDVPATIFVSSGMIETEYEFWWDSLDDIFLSDVPNTRRELEIEIDGTYYKWIIQNFEEANTVYYKLHALIKTLPRGLRDIKIDELYNWSGKQRKQRPSHAVLSKAQLKKLASLNGIEIGAHTVSHPRLSNETVQLQREEIANSKNDLEQLIGREINSFSYPFGAHEDFTDASAFLVQECGYTCGLANIQETVFKTTNPYRIPRRLVRNWDIEEFKSNLEEFFKRPASWADLVKSKPQVKNW